VAVVQISKIQIRRGLKNSSSGVPQLSSAELAWAVDSQELYIGNGSVSEGAPYVGNTKVLTEHDNILELASSYEFAYDDPSITQTVPRSLQGKVDEYVSVLDFGAKGNGSTDNVAAFQAAFTELFRSTNTDYRKVLRVPNGEYVFDSDLSIPSNVILEGETQDGAILNIGSNSIKLISSNGTIETNFSSTDRPQNIQLRNLTISRTTGQTELTGALDSLIENVKFKGTYSLGDTVTNLSIEPAAVYWNNTLSGTKVTNVTFHDCVFESNSVGVRCNQSIVDATYLTFLHCEFFELDTGIYITGEEGQGNNWNIESSKFEEVAKQAFRSSNGTGTKIESCKFVNCGNDTNTASSPVGSIVYFGQSDNNIVKDCSSDRQQDAGVTSSNSVAAVTEVYNGSLVNFVDRINSQIYLSDSFRPVAVFSAENKHFYIDYVLRLSVHTRAGRLTLAVDDDFENVSISDHYQYSSGTATHPGGVLMTNFEFNATLKDNDSDSGIETIVLTYKNPLATGVTGDISFDVSYGV